MKAIFHLSDSHPDLSLRECQSLLKVGSYRLYDDLLIADYNPELRLENRLGQCHTILRFLFRCKKSSLMKKIRAYDWQKIYEKDFCVRFHDDKSIPEKGIADIIYGKLTNPKVNLTDPKTKIVFHCRRDLVICGLLISDVDKSFTGRRAHLRPSLHPTSMHPGLARTMINLTGLKKGIILDPFCGSGGILIEAGLMGFKTIGYDIDEGQVRRARKNIDFYMIKDCRLERKDALTMGITPDAIVTDFPYGKGSVGKMLPRLYEDFLKAAYPKTGVAVVMMPDFIDHKKIISSTRWKIKDKFGLYVHKSLTRILLVLRKS